MFELTEDQAAELERLQAVVTLKRAKLLELEKAIKVGKGYKRGFEIDQELSIKLEEAELELKEASYAFNNFTGSLPLSRKSG
ncbi:hypothetical protein ACFSJU_12065 [Paradesertivirga mongoliensis]|uniref:Uncharacterized protein n=1 Tax=Paradesertivirga mongoliensis TaxID=2100740 RepID=A0ABW4ZMS4_9SPHI|nr:hypothetical protein [Pedobacter mongoliensis]